MFIHLEVYLGIIVLLAVVPGANNAVVTRQTLLGGRRSGLLTVAGTSTGVLVWAALSALGISALLLAQPKAMLALHLVGAGILAALGLLTLRTVRNLSIPSADTTVATRSGHAMLAGLGSSLGNPKAALFAVALLPQFIATSAPAMLPAIVLGFLWAGVSGLWFAAYVVVLDRTRRAFDSARSRRYLTFANAIALLGLAAATLASA